MKKAFIDQIMLGFFLFFSLIVFGASISDEYIARQNAYELEKIVKIATRSLSKHYIYNEDMSDAQTITNTLISNTKLGQEVLNKNLISYSWFDNVGDGEPNIVRASISNYVHDNFWFRFLGTDTFTLPSVSAMEFVTKDQSDIVSISMRYGGSNAGYHNMIGTYELDENNCITNAKLVLVNKDEHSVGDDLGSFTNLKTRFFIVPDGFDKYGSRTASLDSDLTITGCEGSIPNVTINNHKNSGLVYFQDTYFNTDNGYDHMRELGKSYFDDYEDFINTPIKYCKYYRRGYCRSWGYRDATWEDWHTYAVENSIDYSNDPNDEYIITMEDLPNGGDKDFNDINLDTTKVRIPRTAPKEELEDAVDVSP